MNYLNEFDEIDYDIEDTLEDEEHVNWLKGLRKFAKDNEEVLKSFIQQKNKEKS